MKIGFDTEREGGEENLFFRHEAAAERMALSAVPHTNSYSILVYILCTNKRGISLGTDLSSLSLFPTPPIERGNTIIYIRTYKRAIASSVV